jgi:hypothetical protein
LALDRSSALAPLIFTFEDGHHFDQPSATRMLTGFIRTLNDYNSDQASSSYVGLNTATKNLNIILNCNQEEVDKYLTHSIPSDTVEFAVSNNIMNMVYPHSYEFRLNSILNRIMMFNPRLHGLYEKYNLRNARGLLRLTKDGQLLDQIEKQSGFSKPGIKFVNDNATGEEIMRISSSVFIEF